MAGVIAAAQTGQVVRTWQPDDMPAEAGPAGRVAETPSPSWEELEIVPQPASASSPALPALQPALTPPSPRSNPQGMAPGIAGLRAWNAPELGLLPILEPSSSDWAVSRETPGLARLVPKEAERKAAEILLRAEGQARQILQKAEAQAAEWIRQAEAQAEEVTRQAYASGWEAADADVKYRLQASTAIVQEVNTWREGQLAQGEMMMLRLVIEIAQSIFGEGLPLDPETLGQIFARALAQAKTLGDLRIYVHPEDAAALHPYWSQRQSALSGQQIELIPADIIQRGGCFVEGQYGSVDARVDSQLELVKETLFSTYAASAGGASAAESPPFEVPADHPEGGVE